MAKTVKQRLRRIDRIGARIDRRLGFLESVLFCNGSEVPIVPSENGPAIVDQGISTRQVNGMDLEGHRYTVNVDGDWWEENRKLRGNWTLQRNEDSQPIRVTVEGQTVQDDQTFVVLTLRVENTINTSGVVIP